MSARDAGTHAHTCTCSKVDKHNVDQCCCMPTNRERTSATTTTAHNTRCKGQSPVTESAQALCMQIQASACGGSNRIPQPPTRSKHARRGHGQTWSTVVKHSQLWSNTVKPQPCQPCLYMPCANTRAATKTAAVHRSGVLPCTIALHNKILPLPQTGPQQHNTNTLKV